MYYGQSLTNKLWTKKKLYSLRMRKSDDLTDYLPSEIQSRVSRALSAARGRRSCATSSVFITSCYNVITTLMYCKETLVYDEVVNVLRSNETKDMLRDAYHELHAVNEARGRQQTKEKHFKPVGRQRSNSRDRTSGSPSKSRNDQKEQWRGPGCYSCGEYGHIARNSKRGSSSQSKNYGLASGEAGKKKERCCVSKISSLQMRFRRLTSQAQFISSFCSRASKHFPVKLTGFF